MQTFKIDICLSTLRQDRNPTPKFLCWNSSVLYIKTSVQHYQLLESISTYLLSYLPGCNNEKNQLSDMKRFNEPIQASHLSQRYKSNHFIDQKCKSLGGETTRRPIQESVQQRHVLQGTAQSLAGFGKMSGVNFCAALMLPLIFILPLQEHFRHFISKPKMTKRYSQVRKQKGLTCLTLLSVMNF